MIFIAYSLLAEVFSLFDYYFLLYWCCGLFLCEFDVSFGGLVGLMGFDLVVYLVLVVIWVLVVFGWVFLVV